MLGSCHKFNAHIKITEKIVLGLTLTDQKNLESLVTSTWDFSYAHMQTQLLQMQTRMLIFILFNLSISKLWTFFPHFLRYNNSLRTWLAVSGRILSEFSYDYHHHCNSLNISRYYLWVDVTERHKFLQTVVFNITFILCVRTKSKKEEWV